MTVRQSETFLARGSVVRVTLRNFMTYVNETFWPGPNFNVVVGANGSGKSSIVTALCICLGGELKFLNRQSDLSSLVNNSSRSSEAQVEVELFDPNDDNIIVQCSIFNDGGTLFKVNGRKVSRKELTTLMEKLQIQPGNMCQFLPQDVVRDFPTMTNQDIFYNTVTAVGNMSLIDTYDKLKKIQTEVDQLDSQVEIKCNTLTNLERKEKKLEFDKNIYEERRGIEEKKLVIENALKWEKFKALRARVKKTRDEERILKIQKDKLEKEQEPAREFLRNYEAMVKAQKERIEKADKEYTEQCNKVEEFDISDYEDTLDRLTEQLRDLTQQESNRVANKKKITEDINNLESYLSSNTLDPNIEDTLKVLIDKRSKYEANLQRMKINLSTLESNQMNFNREKEKLTRSKNDLEDQKERKLTTLQRENPDAYEGVQWLAANRHLFKAPVHDPIMLSLDVKDKSLARYVETHIGRADLEGFVCENPEDVNILTKQLREKLKLRKINAFHSNPDPPSKFRHPVSRDEMVKYTIIDYISDMYSAPPAVHAYLCNQKRLHEVPVLREENNHSVHLKTKFHNYYIGNQKFNTRKSKYSGELSTGMEDIAGRQIIRLADVVDTQEVQRVDRELEETQKQIISNSSRIAINKKTCDQLEVEIGKLSEEINKLRQQKKDFSNRQSELDMKRRTLEQMNEPTYDVNAKKEEIRTEKSRAVKQLVRVIKKHSQLTKKSVTAETNRRLLHLTFQRIESENSHNMQKLADMERELESIKTRFEDVSKVWDRDKKALQDSHTQARNATGILSNEVKYKPPEEWQAKFDALGSTEEAVLGTFLDECNSELKHLKVIPEQTIADIEALKEKLGAAREEKDSLERNIVNKRHEAKKLKLKWINGVKELVDNVNDKFGSMMANLGYNGEISLSQGNDDIDFSSYGIKIQVNTFSFFHPFDELLSTGEVQTGPGTAGPEQGNPEWRREVGEHRGVHDGSAGDDPGPLQMCG